MLHTSDGRAVSSNEEVDAAMGDLNVAGLPLLDEDVDVIVHVSRVFFQRSSPSVDGDVPCILARWGEWSHSLVNVRIDGGIPLTSVIFPSAGNSATS